MNGPRADELYNAQQPRRKVWHFSTCQVSSLKLALGKRATKETRDYTPCGCAQDGGLAYKKRVTFSDRGSRRAADHVSGSLHPGDRTKETSPFAAGRDCESRSVSAQLIAQLFHDVIHEERGKRKSAHAAWISWGFSSYSSSWDTRANEETSE